MFAMLKLVSRDSRSLFGYHRDTLFPSLSSRSSGGLWSSLLPGVGDCSSSSAGPSRGAAAVNHTSEMGSGLTCARCLLGRIWRRELLPAEVDLQR